jgi:hypothetical protein
MVIGALLLALALFADTLGIGVAGSDFGWKQMLGTMLGAGILFGGARGWWEIARARRTEREG